MLFHEQLDRFRANAVAMPLLEQVDADLVGSGQVYRASDVSRHFNEAPVVVWVTGNERCVLLPCRHLLMRDVDVRLSLRQQIVKYPGQVRMIRDRDELHWLAGSIW